MFAQVRKQDERALSGVQTPEGEQRGKEMNYSDTMEKAKTALDNNETEKAQALATMAVADRLDRLCEILSARNVNRQRW